MKNLFLFVLTGSMLMACGRQQAPVATTTQRPVKVTQVEPLGYIDKDFAGMATADSVSNLAFTVSGQIVKMYVEEGSRVRRGQVIAQLLTRDFDLSVEATRSAFLTAKAQLERSTRLLQKQAVSQQDYEIAQTRLVEARAQFEAAQGSLSDTKLRAPFSGVIEKRFADNYQRMQAGEKVVLLVEPTTRQVRFTMPESGIAIINSKPTFTVEFDNYAGVKFKARLKEFVSTAIEGTGLPVTLRLEDNKLRQYEIAPGMSCTINLTVDNKLIEGATAVPVSALFSPQGKGDYVWVVTEGQVKAQKVTPGVLYGANMVSIKSGLEAGQSVVTAGVYQLAEGQKVKILK